MRKEVVDDKCFINWKKSSTSMEADGVVEGFLKSLEMHGLKFNRLIIKIKMTDLSRVKRYVLKPPHLILADPCT